MTVRNRKTGFFLRNTRTSPCSGIKWLSVSAGRFWRRICDSGALERSCAMIAEDSAELRNEFKRYYMYFYSYIFIIPQHFCGNGLPDGSNFLIVSGIRNISSFCLPAKNRGRPKRTVHGYVCAFHLAMMSAVRAKRICLRFSVPSGTAGSVRRFPPVPPESCKYNQQCDG